jgi:DNA repair exonuclease SbcCD ATPase subunit
MRWSNWFSYGEDNYIDFTKNTLTQISGANGSGKSSIALIIEEVLYAKNHKGIKKAKLANRYVKNPALLVLLNFRNDDDEYTIDFKRKSTVSISLYKNGEDISSHTSTETYKTLNNIFKHEFNTFAQILYQSSTQGLDFLQATDTTRKRFLITLFNQNYYLGIHEKAKKAASTVNSELQQLSGKVVTLESWVEKHLKEDLTEKELLQVPALDKELIDKLTDLKSQLNSMIETNKKINTNNQYKALLNELDTSILNENITVPDKRDLIKKKKELEDKKLEKSVNIKTHKADIDRIKKLPDECYTCGQKIESELKNEIISKNATLIEKLNDESTMLDDHLKELNGQIKIIENLERKYLEKQKVSNELTNLLKQIDNEIPEDVLDKEIINEEIIRYTSEYKQKEDDRMKAVNYNTAASSHNSKVKVIREQLKEYKEQLEIIREQVYEKDNINSKLEIIKKTFSPSGLPSYKIEFLVKDLEKDINEYLQELSKGRFQFQFMLSGDKLNIDIYDDDKVIGIEELSAGELARVNTATLLAIRKQMASISSIKINLLFLDEIMGTLDEEGKEKLIEVLHNEKDLNTFLVSHEYSHPLIPKLNIIKENKISRIENG